MMKNFASFTRLDFRLFGRARRMQQKQITAIQTIRAAVTARRRDSVRPHPPKWNSRTAGHYTGALVSKSGSQMTFRGDNGATRTFDSRDIKSIRFGIPQTPVANAPVSNLAPSSGAPTEQAQSSRPRDRSSDASDTAANDTPRRRLTAAQAIVIPTGTQLQVRTNQAIDSKVASAGQTFSAEIANDVTDESGRVVIPRGSPAALVIKQASAGKVKSNSLVLDMQSISVQGKEYDVETADVSEAGKQGVGMNKRSGKYMGGGAALGAIIGAIAGGGKGAAIGAASGVGAGAATQVLTRGSVKVPAESLLTFRLELPLRSLRAIEAATRVVGPPPAGQERRIALTP